MILVSDYKMRSSRSPCANIQKVHFKLLWTEKAFFLGSYTQISNLDIVGSKGQIKVTKGHNFKLYFELLCRNKAMWTSRHHEGIENGGIR